MPKPLKKPSTAPCHISSRVMRGFGEGAEHDTRGRVRPQNQTASSSADRPNLATTETAARNKVLTPGASASCFKPSAFITGKLAAQKKVATTNRPVACND